MKHLVVSTLLLMAACAPLTSSPDVELVQAEILQAEQRELAGWAARDVDVIMKAYTDDTMIMAAGAPVRDYGAARQFFTRALTDPGFTLTFRSDPPIVAASADLGVATGTYSVTFTNADGQVERVDGYHLLTWVRGDDNIWRICRQLTGPAPPSP